jgi:hypothetical protein
MSPRLRLAAVRFALAQRLTNNRNGPVQAAVNGSSMARSGGRATVAAVLGLLLFHTFAAQEDVSAAPPLL